MLIFATILIISPTYDVESELKTPFLLLQIRLGADIQLKDINSRNVLHLVVMNGGRLEDFAANCKVR